jgi:hypothetical protein
MFTVVNINKLHTEFVGVFILCVFIRGRLVHWLPARNQKQNADSARSPCCYNRYENRLQWNVATCYSARARVWGEGGGTDMMIQKLMILFCYLLNEADIVQTIRRPAYSFV